jgi:hypothetical protein
MLGEANHTYTVADDIPTTEIESAARAESQVASSTSSSTMADQAMVRKEIPSLCQYWKAPTVADKDIVAYHDAGWLSGVLVYTPTTLDFPTIDQTNIICFESHLMYRLGLPPSKFLVSVLNYIGCKLVHLHPKAILMLSYFSMLCECWLGIPPDTSLFWHFYSPTRYEHRVFSEIGLTLRRNH